MENFEQTDLLDSSMFDMSIEPAAANKLKSAALWGKVISVIIWIIVAMFLIFLLFFKNAFNSASSFLFNRFNLGDFGEIANSSGFIILFLFVFIIGLIASGFVFFLFMGSNKVKKGIEQSNIEKIDKGLGYFKIFIIISTIYTGITTLFSFVSLFF